MGARAMGLFLAAACAAAPAFAGGGGGHQGGRHPVAENAASLYVRPENGPQGGPTDAQNGAPGNYYPPPSPTAPPETFPPPEDSTPHTLPPGAPPNAPPEAADEEPAPALPDPPVRMSAADLRENVATVIETYVARHSVDGRWPYRERKGGPVRDLELVKIDAASLRKEGNDRYAAPATLRDTRGGKTVVLEFAVDLSGSHWSVTAVRPRPKKK